MSRPHPPLPDPSRRAACARTLAGVLAGVGACLQAARGSPAGGGAAGAAGGATADDVKAAYLHKFAGYVDWPASAFATTSTPFVVAVVGAEAVAESLSRVVAGRPVQGRPMVVRRLARPSELTPDVTLLFVGRDAARELPAWSSAVTGRPVMVVTDAPGGLAGGASIAFVESDARVRFEAAPAVAEANGLRLNARLLAVAERVVGSAP